MLRKRIPTKFQHGGNTDNSDVNVVYDTGFNPKRTLKEVAEIGGAFAEILPVIGTLTDAYSFYKDPSWKNAGYLAAGLASDIPLIGWVGKGAKALKALEKIKAYRKMKNAMEIKDPVTDTAVAALSTLFGASIDAQQAREDLENADKGRLPEVIVTPQGVSKAPPQRYVCGGKLRRRLSI